MMNFKLTNSEAFKMKRNEIKYHEENYDSKTGQKLYVPKISKNKNVKCIDRELQGYESVFEALHHEAKILKDKSKNLK